NEHQQASCLTTDYAACPMFDQPEGTPLLPSLRAHSDNGEALKRMLFIGAAAIALLLLLSGLWWLTRDQAGAAAALPPDQTTGVADALASGGGGASMADGGPHRTPEGEARMILDAETATPSPTSTLTPSATATATPTFTPSPSATATPTPSWTPPPSPTPTVTPTPILARAEVAANRVNLRRGPNTDYEVVAVISRGERFTLIGRIDNSTWYLICCTDEGESGWVYFETVAVEGDPEAVPVVGAPYTPPTPSP
ncbi:MAG: SH3 domain-containing protein, partial [Candidatus Promineifilaceae bacterium]|nr:SH3 domain-containing protein [Candidatus Promineifilaceae bacterium]